MLFGMTRQSSVEAGIGKSIARERAPYVSILLGGWGRIAD